MVPKQALDVMSCEVIRVLQLTDNCIIPISYQVPRKVCVHTDTPTQAAFARDVLVLLFSCALCCAPAITPGVS